MPNLRSAVSMVFSVSAFPALSMVMVTVRILMLSAGVTDSEYASCPVSYINSFHELMALPLMDVILSPDTMPHFSAGLPGSMVFTVLGSRGVELPGMAVDFKVTTDPGTRRIARAAFEYARQNGKTRVSVVTKANIMKKTDGKFTAICHEVAQDYPEISVDDWYIDIMTANLVNEAIRDQFQVVLLPNLYGDIITDEAAQIQGGVGTAGSANVGDRYAMFEAIHGSAPRMIAEGLGAYANPASILKAEAMLLRHICRPEAAQRLESALERCKVVVTGDATGATGAAFADEIMKLL